MLGFVLVAAGNAADPAPLPADASPSVTLQQAYALRDWTIGLRRDLHKCPELLYDLLETSAFVRKVLDGLHIPYQYPVAQEGIVATIGTGEAPCVALRADMDALPIHEEVDSSYRWAACWKRPLGRATARKPGLLGMAL